MTMPGAVRAHCTFSPGPAPDQDMRRIRWSQSRQKSKPNAHPASPIAAQRPVLAREAQQFR